ncbi:MAG: DNA repair exonuclease SbcCD ATPase subunit [Phage 5P_2]|nr:MAG: DNA repair exonuclease SbcCD ATPase subunit [Phage 5P_2]
MIPQNLSLHNFTSFSEANIDFSQVSIACLSGPNGAGKSSILDAILFALYGRTERADGADDLVRRGTQDMSVELTFMLNGQQYRVTRVRSLTGRGKSVMELAVWGESGWQPMTGKTIKETEAALQALLRMDYKTFISSVMILQGRADEFTRATPAERKTILGQILGLDIYDSLQEVARSKVRSIEGEIKALNGRLDEIKQKLAKRDEVKGQEATFLTYIQDLTEQIQTHNGRIAELQKSIAALEAEAGKQKELEDERRRLEDEIAALRAEGEALQKKADQARKVLEAEKDILKYARQYESAKQQLAVLEAKLPRLTALDQELKSLEQQRSQVGRRLAQIGAQIKDLEALLANRPALEQAAAEYEKAISDLETMEAVAEQWLVLDNKAREVQLAYQKAAQEVKTRRQALETEMANLERKVAMMADSGCLDPERATCRFLADAQEAKVRLVQLAPVYEALKNGTAPEIVEASRLQKEYLELEAKRDALGYDPQKRQQLKDLAAALRPKAEQATKLASKAELLENLREQERQEHQQLSRELASLNQLREAIPELEKWAKAKESLPAARQVVQEAQEREDWYKSQIASREERLAAVSARLADVAGAAAKIVELKSQMVLAQREASSAQAKLQDAQRQLGMVQQSLTIFEQLEVEAGEIEAKVGQGMAEQWKYQVLATAFSKNGVPALIIENSVPAIEAIANELLGLMSSGQMAVNLVTQREKKTGGLSETLDIVINDGMGAREYSTFSGAERFKVDLALRIAISEFLAQRAGSSVETLVIDEGLGALDPDGRNKFIEAINAIRGRFKKILVVTHLEELKDAFPSRLQVEKTPQGSVVRIA